MPQLRLFYFLKRIGVFWGLVGSLIIGCDFSHSAKQQTTNSALQTPVISGSAYKDFSTKSIALSWTGDFVDSAGNLHQITATQWQTHFSEGNQWYVDASIILSFEEEQTALITQNSDPWQKYNRVELTVRGNTLFYCLSVEDQETPPFSLEFSIPVDARNPAVSGCGNENRPWIALRPVSLEIKGNYLGTSQTPHSITHLLWQQGRLKYHLLRFNNAQNYAIAQNAVENSVFPGKFSRFDWMYFEAQLYVCHTIQNADTLLQADDYQKAESSDPKAHGCQGQAWERLNEYTAFVGNYMDAAGTLYALTATQWNFSGFVYTEKNDATTPQINEQTVIAINLIQSYLITQDADGRAFQRYDWADFQGVRYLCQRGVSQKTQAIAESLSPPEPSAPNQSGCDDHAWISFFAIPLPVFDQYVDEFGLTHSISSLSWQIAALRYHLIQLNTKEHYAIAFNDLSHPVYPGSFSRLDWTTYESQKYFCHTTANALNTKKIEEVLAPDTSNPEYQGCGNQPWRLLKPPLWALDFSLEEKVFANRVIRFAPISGTLPKNALQNPQVVLGSLENKTKGVALGYDKTASLTTGGSLTVGMGTENQNYCISDGLGDDLIVYSHFEAPEAVPGKQEVGEVAYLEVSEDGKQFYRFPFQLYPAMEKGEKGHYEGLIGIEPEGDWFDLRRIIEEYALLDQFRACSIHLIDTGTQIEDISTDGMYGDSVQIKAIQALHFEEMK
ncbi:hypothetical protein WDW89_14650 [Deltaproteobacteria bacterium TL4]